MYWFFNPDIFIKILDNLEIRIDQEKESKPEKVIIYVNLIRVRKKNKKKTMMKIFRCRLLNYRDYLPEKTFLNKKPIFSSKEPSLI